MPKDKERRHLVPSLGPLELPAAGEKTPEAEAEAQRDGVKKALTRPTLPQPRMPALDGMEAVWDAAEPPSPQPSEEPQKESEAAKAWRTPGGRLKPPKNI